MEAYLPEEAQNKIYRDMCNLSIKAERSDTPSKCLIPTIIPPESISILRGTMGRLGLNLSEIDKMIQWRIRPSRQTAREPLIKMIRFLTQLTDIEMY